MLRRILPLALAALAACPSVDRVEQPQKLAFATFDSTTPTIPLPNDLALQRAPGLPAGVQKELLGSFVAAGGFPADQEVAITIPITVRTKQADGTYGAPAAPEGIDLATVDDSHVALYRVDVTPAQRLSRCASPVTAACWEPSYAIPASSTSGVLSLRRNDPSGNRRWDAGGRYVVGLRTGIRTSDGLPVGADGAIALIAPNKPLTVSENQPPGGLPPSLAATAESLRSVYATGRTWAPVSNLATCTAAGVPATPCWIPVPSSSAPAAFDVVSQAFPAAELAAIQTFAVQPASSVRPLTDTGSGQLPLPSDFLLDPSSGKVRNLSAFGPAATGLATLDGFSTTAPLLIPLTGPVDATTITRSTARIYDLSSGAPVQLTDLTQFPTQPQIVTQPPTSVSNGRASSVVLAPAVPVESGLPQPVYVPPLKEKTQYLVVVTNGVKDAAGQPLTRSTLMDLVFTFNGALYDPAKPAGSRSLVPGVADADAAGLQQLRTSLKPVLQLLHLDTCANNAECAVLAYTVKTQNVKDASVQLAAAPYSIEGTASAPIFRSSGTTDFPTAAIGVPFSPATFPGVRRFVQTNVPTLYAIQGTTGAFDPAFATWTPQQVQQHLRSLPALVAIPECASPCTAPLVVFNHGINGSRLQMIPVASALAQQGFVVAAIDMPYHGSRALCSQNADCLTAAGGTGTCTPDPTLQTPADATAPGRCAAGETPATSASGKFFISSNFFRIRDGLRQNLIDQSALVLALARPLAGVPAAPVDPSSLGAALAAEGVTVDPTRVYFAGLSLGSMVGTSIVAANPRFSRAVLNVPGGTLVDVFTTSPAFSAQLTSVFQPLGIDLACVQTGTGCDAATRSAQTARYAQTLAIAKWILDPADPVNYAANVQTKLQSPIAAFGTPTTEAYGQMVIGDQVVPNPTNRLFLNLSMPGRFTIYDADPVAVPNSTRHGLLGANFTSAQKPQGDAIRADLASFLATGTLPTPLAPTVKPLP